MTQVSDTERMLTFEKSLIGKRITVNKQGKITCPLRMWHGRGDFLDFQATPQTEGNFIPAKCKWCRSFFHISLAQEGKEQLATIQSADISKLSEEHRRQLCLSLKGYTME